MSAVNAGAKISERIAHLRKNDCLDGSGKQLFSTGRNMEIYKTKNTAEESRTMKLSLKKISTFKTCSCFGGGIVYAVCVWIFKRKRNSRIFEAVSAVLAARFVILPIAGFSALFASWQDSFKKAL